MTGDIKVATKSSIIVMTTEILHNMLCSSADTIRDLEIVIMDEVRPPPSPLSYLPELESKDAFRAIIVIDYELIS